MRFMYAYKSSDGTRHEDEISAESREAVFEELRRRGIRAIKVVACDGSKANGEVRPQRRKRWLALSALVGAVVASAIFTALDRSGDADIAADSPRSGTVQAQANERVATPRTRRQIGLEAITNAVPLESIFAHPSEALLARFAEPGRLVKVDVSGDTELAEDFRDALETPIVITAEDTAEIAELKRIVVGIKDEAKMMMASGRSFEEAVDYFVAQQLMEARYRETILSQDSSVDEKNRLLSALGLVPIKEANE
ncbi:MAG: hypothetical protein K6F50_05005 [Kiritimatiellae bacterium]|nr:hypothetical protein [Kiritimatiellia bacterium]